MKLLKGLFLLLVTTAGAKAEEPGVDYFAIQGFSPAQCREALKVFRGVKHPKLAYLYKTFARGKDPNHCVREFIRRHKRKRHTLHIHAFNNTSLRFPRRPEPVEVFFPLSSPGAVNSDLLKRKSAVMRRMEERLDELFAELESLMMPKTRVSISLGLEDDYTSAVWKKLEDNLITFLPERAKLVRNPNDSTFSRHPLAGVDALELHALESQYGGARCFWSNDGYDIDFGGGYKPLKNYLSVSRIRRLSNDYRASGCRVFLWWNNQGVPRDGRFIEPSRRTLSIDPRAVSLIRNLIRE